MDESWIDGQMDRPTDRRTKRGCVVCVVVDQCAHFFLDITTSTPVVTGKLLYQSITPHEGSFLHSTSHNNSKAATSKSKVGTQPSTTTHTTQPLFLHCLCPSICSSIHHLSIRLSICLSVCPSVCQFVSLFVNYFLCLFICLSSIRHASTAQTL